ncbi:MAG: hypothetical protein HGA96_09690 [Desulfobulbaceae bacterium]|nr:hypothetical protein [Desulfobulbaceae bacterium]
MKLITESEKLIQWLDKKIDGLEFPGDDRSRIVAGCFDMALEHQKAVILLIANKLTGSAFSLIRSQFESYIRGLWLKNCASEKEIYKFKNNKFEKKFNELIADVEKIEGYEGGTLSRTKKSGWAAMNSFTHSGFSQIVRRITESTIESNYDKEEIIEAINFANAIGLLSGLEIAFLSGNESLSVEILEKAKETNTPNQPINQTA